MLLLVKILMSAQPERLVALVVHVQTLLAVTVVLAMLVTHKLVLVLSQKPVKT